MQSVPTPRWMQSAFPLSWTLACTALACVACSGEGGTEDPASAGTGGNAGGGALAGTSGAATGGGAGSLTGGDGGAATSGASGAATGGASGATTGGSSGAVIGGTGGDGTGGSAGSTSSTGCGQAPPAQVPTQVDVAGATGTFLLSVPPGYDGSTPTPIVFAFHGAGTSGEMFSSQYYGNLLSTLANDFIVVHPDALDGNAWDAGADIPFFDAMLDLLSRSYCVDDNRIFATGHSSGGFFSNNLACERGDVLRAIAPVSGGGPFVWGGATCTGQVAAWIAHGDADDTVALTSGEGSRDHWVEANGCDTSQTSTPSASYPCLEYGGCDAGFPVRWCVYSGGHEWPDFGPQGIYDFFSSF